MGIKVRNKISNYIIITTLVIALLVSAGKATSISALAVGPIADPVYETEIYAFKDYVEQNLDAPQLDIMFFLIGGLAIAQMGAQDAMLISPYPNEESVKEWIINCGIQLYNSVIGLVPEGDYFMGIPSIGTAGIKGVPRQVIKALVAQMMGDAVVAINYPDLDTFLEENPDKILLPINADLQLGVNAIFGLNGGLPQWQYLTDIDFEFSYNTHTFNTTSENNNYSSYLLSFTDPLNVNTFNNGYNGKIDAVLLRNILENQHINFFYNTTNNTFYSCDNSGQRLEFYLDDDLLYYTWISSSRSSVHFENSSNFFIYKNNVTGSIDEVFNQFITNTESFFGYYNSQSFKLDLNLLRSYSFYFGNDWEHRFEYTFQNDLNISDNVLEYYQQVANDYLFDLRGLMGDLVNYVYLNPIWDNIYDLVGNLVVPDRVNVSVDLTPITDLLAPPIPVNLNDVALYTDNDYIEEIKYRGRKFGEVIGQYIIFWHNSDPATCYILLGGSVVILLAAFIGKWGHS